MDFFSSDFHFFHSNVIKYSNRPFKDVFEMNDVIIQNINNVVLANDRLFFLGDFALNLNLHGGINAVQNLRDRINCNYIHFVWGNHDQVIQKEKDKLAAGSFVWYKDYYEHRLSKGRSICLMHYAMRIWNKSHHGSYHLFGHSHGTLPDDTNSLSFDCGVDTNNFMPYSLDDVHDRMRLKNFKPVDHHTDKTY